jgi:hypothetical protein
MWSWLLSTWQWGLLRRRSATPWRLAGTPIREVFHRFNDTKVNKNLTINNQVNNPIWLEMEFSIFQTISSLKFRWAKSLESDTLFAAH